MRTFKFYLALYLVLAMGNLEANADSWTQKANFGGGIRHIPVGFSIGSKGYIGTGQTNASGVNTDLKRDFWEYDPGTNLWTQKADFGGGNRSYAIGFSIGSKGYIGLGVNANGAPLNSYQNDFWEYNPATNIWTIKASFGGLPRAAATGFSIGTKGYIGAGIDNTSQWRKDFWEYNPSTNAWIQKANIGGPERQAACGFSIGSKGYMGVGGTLNDFWEYNPGTDVWTQKANFGGVGRAYAASFSINGYGYIGTGYDGTVKNDMWRYNPSNDTWTQVANFSGSARSSGASFSIGNKGYIGAGYNGVMINEFWEYDSGIASIPTLSEWGLISLSILLLSIGVFFIRNKMA